ncbi:hypothetical protein [Caballeronia sp. KNU42]
MAIVTTTHGDMDQADLLKLEGGFENDNEIVTWVQYHLPASGEMVHRSAHVHLKDPVAAEAIAAMLG